MKKQGKVPNKTRHGLWGDLVNQYSNLTGSAQPEVVTEIEKVSDPPRRGRPKGSTNKKTASKKKKTTKAMKNPEESDENANSDDDSNKKVDNSKYICLFLFLFFSLVVDHQYG